MSKMLEKAVAAAAAEMQKIELIDAVPSVIAALQARRVARAVLLAVREPDDALSKAVQSTEGWEAMIDAILNEKPEGMSDV